MPFQVVRQVAFRGEVRQRTTEVAGDVLRIGRGTSNDVHLEDLSVSLQHAEITRRDQDRYVLRDLTGTGATYVNRAPVMEAVLRNGDAIRIQGYVLTVSQPEAAGPLHLVVQEQSPAMEAASPGFMPRFQLAHGRWTRARLAALLTGLVLVGAMAALFLGHRSVFMPGAISMKHAKFAEQCDKCHASWKAVWNLVPNKTCQACHPADILTPSHFADRALTPAPQCASCHLEHKGQTLVAAISDGQCVQCHGDLKVTDPTVPVSRAVHSFTKDHPEFALSMLLPGRVTPTRVRFDDKTVLKDGGRLKLNHEVHLAPDLPTSNGRETLSCASCHRVDREGRYMQSITYERDCMRCHALEFDPQLPGKSVTHGRQPIDVKRELEEIYAAFFMRSFPEQAKGRGGMRRLPGQPPTPQELYVEERTERAERILYPPRGKKCVKCHMAEAGPPDAGSGRTESATRATPASHQARSMSVQNHRTPDGGPTDSEGQVDAASSGGETLSKDTRQEAAELAESADVTAQRVEIEAGAQPEKSDHFVEGKLDNVPAKTLTGSGFFQILKVNVPDRWLPYSRFDHAAHFGLSEIKKKGNLCLACHEQATTSTKTEDVLLPAIGLCRTCHMEPGGAQAGCKACHEFHPKAWPAKNMAADIPSGAAQDAKAIAVSPVPKVGP